MSRPGLLASFMGVVTLLALPALAHAQYGGAPGGPPAAVNPLGQMMNAGPGIAPQNTHSDTEHALKDTERGLNDVDPKVRVEALRKLRDVSDPRATSLLIQSLSDPDARVKIKAIDLLGSRQATEAVPYLSQLLFLRSVEPAVKLHVAAALGRIGDTRGAEPVIEYIKETTDERSRGTAVYALGEIGDPSAMDVLSTAATEDPSPMVRHLAQEAIEKIDGELPSSHPVKTANNMVPTDQRLSKLRQMDAELNRR
jgi:HEAT repeat protein